ncbi:MAG: TIGR02597 family protein [Akkermansiaceae bacterium]
MTRLISSLGIVALPLFLGTLLNAQTVTDPVGVVKIDINAATVSGPTFTFLSTSMSREVAYQGTVSSGATGTVTVSGASWSTNQFATDATYASHYVIVASGSREGELIDIVSNSTDTLTLDSTEDQNDLSTFSIRVYKHNTIASIFGADPEAGTVQKGNKDTADLILTFNSLTGAYETYYFNTATNPLPVGGVFHQGWVKSSDLTADASSTPIYPDDGFLYKRVPMTPFTISVNGSVIVSKIKVPVINGYNLITIPYPVDKSITLDNSGLRPGDGETFDSNIHLTAGNKDTADHVVMFNSGSQSFETYYFNNASNPLPVGGVFHQGWVKSTQLTADAASTAIPAGTAIFILRRNGNPAFNWNFDSVVSE